MRNAYALLGLSFLIVFGGAYVLIERTERSPLPAVTEERAMELSITSPDFEHNGSIPARFTCEGENTHPNLEISGVPEGTRSLALLVTDYDLPEEIKTERNINKFDHWVLFNIPADTEKITAGKLPPGAVEGKNSTGGMGYTGPCPPAEYEPTEHRYNFRLYALSDVLPPDQDMTLSETKAAMEEHLITETELIGRYQKQAVGATIR